MGDRRDLAVDGDGRAHHLAAEHLADRLMAEADAEDRDFRAGLADEVEADAGLARRARAGREDDRVGRAIDDVGHARRIVAHDLDLGAERTEIVHQVPGEAVVIVDQDDGGAAHGCISAAAARGVKAAVRPIADTGSFPGGLILPQPA